MDAIKGLARRATQSFREKVTHADSTTDDKLDETSKKVRLFEKHAVTLSDKVLRAAKLIEELGCVLKEIGEEVKQVPDIYPEISQLSDETIALGATLIQKAAEHQVPLKDQGFDQLGNFIKEVTKLRDVEEDRKKKQLEYDFFRQKVTELRKNPPKDFTRIPRNEQILENWRVELWKATEANKATASALFFQGQKAIDQTIVTVGQVFNSYFTIATSGLKHTYGNARLPFYPTAPILTPAPLPPNPLPPFVYPNSVPGASPPAQVNYAPTGQDYHSPPAAHGGQAQWSQQSPHGWQQQQPPPPQQQQQQPWQPHPQHAQAQPAWSATPQQPNQPANPQQPGWTQPQPSQQPPWQPHDQHQQQQPTWQPQQHAPPQQQAQQPQQNAPQPQSAAPPPAQPTPQQGTAPYEAQPAAVGTAPPSQ